MPSLTPLFPPGVNGRYGQLSAAYRDGFHRFSMSTITDFELQPTKMSPLRAKDSRERSQTAAMSKLALGFSGSTTTVPLNRFRWIGRFTSMRVV